MNVMLRAVAKKSLIGLLVLAGAVAVYLESDRISSWRQLRRLEREKEQLRRVVERLSAERRVAEALVTEQKTVDGELITTLLFVEYRRDGSALPPRTFTVKGKWIHIDALVIKFDRGYVEQDDYLRGRSIALFTRLYGEKQTPAEGFVIDSPGEPPAIYRDGEAEVSRFETDLWRDFWRLADDPAYRAQHGVRVANGQGVWGPFEPDKLYTLSIESDGGVNIHSEPLKGIYKEAMKQRP